MVDEGVAVGEVTLDARGRESGRVFGENVGFLVTCMADVGGGRRVVRRAALRPEELGGCLVADIASVLEEDVVGGGAGFTFVVVKGVGVQIARGAGILVGGASGMVDEHVLGEVAEFAGLGGFQEMGLPVTRRAGEGGIVPDILIQGAVSASSIISIIGVDDEFVTGLATVSVKLIHETVVLGKALLAAFVARDIQEREALNGTSGRFHGHEKTGSRQENCLIDDCVVVIKGLVLSNILVPRALGGVIEGVVVILLGGYDQDGGIGHKNELSEVCSGYITGEGDFVVENVGAAQCEEIEL